MPRSFYIDFNAVNDSANGTSTSTPWKRCPGMLGRPIPETYSHQAGDRFIFKGGVTWPSSMFTFTIPGSLSTADYYGGGDTSVDIVAHTWYNGGAWTKPQFDFNSTFGSQGYGLLVTGKNVQIDNIEFYRYKGPGWAGAGCVAVNNGDQNFLTPTVLVSNCHFRAGVHPGDSAADGTTYLTGVNCTARGTFCEFEALESLHLNDSTGNGVLDTAPNLTCAHNVSVIDNCYFHHVVNACLGGAYIHDCEFAQMKHAYSTAGDVHGNCIEPFSNCDIYNNLIHDLGPTVEAIICDPQQPSTFNVYNNVIWNSGGKGISTDTRRAPANTVTYKVYNNTLGPGAGDIGIASPGALFANALVFDVRNNHIASGGGVVYNATFYGAPPTTMITTPNTIQSPSQAAAAGYSKENLYRPTAANSPTVNAGTTLSPSFPDRLGVSRPQGGVWDTGAYEFVSSGGDITAPSVGISSPANGATVSGTVPVTATASDNVGVASVEFLVDGVSKLTDTTAPYSYSLDTTAYADGSHTIQAVARDAAGNSSSSTINVTVQNAVAAAVISVSPSTAYSFGSVAANGTPSDTTYTVSNTGPAGTTLSGTATVASPFSIVSGGTYSLASGVSQSVTVRYRPTVKANDSATPAFTGGAGATRTLSGICYPVLVGLGPHNANTGIVTAPFVVSNTTDVSQPGETLTVAASGRWSAGITVPTPGSYRLDVVVNAPSDSANSLFSNLDAEPTSPGMISDIVSITTGFETRALSWRGAGAFDAPEFAPKTYSLTSGLHEVIIRGREAGTIVRSVQLVSLTAPPPPALTVSTTAAPSSGTVSFAVAFTSTVSGGTSPYTYAWTFGDAGTSTAANPSHTYTIAGTYNAVLTVTDSLGQVATATTTVSATAPPPTPISLFISASPNTGTAPLAVDFASIASGGTAPYSYAWTFDDGGTTSTSASPSHTYSSPGTYHPSLTVTDSSTSPQTATRSITIIDSTPPPSPLGTGISALPSRDVVPLTVSFTSSPVGGTGPYTFAWDFGDSTGTSTSQSPSYIYTVPGDYVIHLTVTDSGSPAQTAQAMAQVTALPLPLTLVVTAAPTTGVAPLAVDFAGIPAGGVSPYTYAWTFGDTGTASTARPSHTYSAAGTYTATCTVTDSASVTASTQRQIVVSAASSDATVPAILYVVP